MEIVKHTLDNSDSMMGLATDLAKFISDKKLCTQIKGKNYVNVEGWQYAGNRLGIIPIITETKDLSTDKSYKYMAKAELRRISDNSIVGTGEALCTNKETKKSGFDEYAIYSMAQTRAIGKAYRNLLSWLMKAAGYEGTPAEEMDNHSDLPPIEEVPEANRQWLNEGTPDFAQAVDMLVLGYELNDLRKRWKISKASAASLDKAFEDKMKGGSDIDPMQVWKDTISQIGSEEELLSLYNQNEAVIQGTPELKKLFTERKNEIKGKVVA